jgi:hypothetical protein
MDVPAADGNGALLTVHDTTGITVTITGAFTANIKIQATQVESPAAGDWLDVPGVSTASPWTFNIKGCYRALRTVLSGYSSGGYPEVKISGFERKD